MAERQPNYVLIGLTLLVAAIVGGALLWGQFGQKTDRAGARPGLAIVTDEMLEAMARQEDRKSEDAARDSEFALVLASMKSVARNNAPNSKEKEASDPAPASTAGAEKQQVGAATMRWMISDQMEAHINGYLTNSKRFAVAEQRSIAQFLNDTAPKPAPQPVSGSGKDAPKSSDVQKAVASTLFSVAGAEPKQETLGQIARNAGVRYLLFVALESPQTTREFTIDDNRALVLQIEADPIFIYRLYDTSGSATTTVFSRVARMQRPESVNVPIDATSLSGDITGKFRADYDRATRELGETLRRRIAEEIAADVIDEVFPGRIVKVDPPTINRGSNDGYVVGDTVQLLSVGDDINDKTEGGDTVAIDAPKTPVGTARVTAVSENSATIQVAGGVTVTDKLIVRRGASGGGSAPSSGGGGGLGLGEMGMAVAQNDASGAVVNRQKIAVGTVSFLSDDTRIKSLPLMSSLESRLQREPRIQLLSRENVASLRREANIDSGRRTYSGSQTGIAQAAYVVVGRVVVNPQRSAQTLSVAGAPTRETSVSWALVAKGAMRVERLDSTLEQSFDVTARVPISGPAAADDVAAAQALSLAFADETSRILMLRLFPTRIVVIQDGQIVVGRGADMGLKAGDRLQAFAMSKPIVDPATNTVISPGVRTPKGFLEVISVEPTASIVRSMGEGYVPAVGDLVEVAPPAAAPAVARPRAASRPAQTQSKEKETATPW